MARTLPAPKQGNRTYYFPTLADFLWAILGLELTIVGTLYRVYIPDTLPQSMIWQWPPQVLWHWDPVYSFSLQVAAVLLTGLLGGPLAGIIAQTTFLGLGLWYYPLFFEGGGLSYLQHPAMGYLVGFIPGSALAGALAYRQRSSLNWLASSALAGLAVIHGCGLLGLVVHYGWNWSLVQGVITYALSPLLGQLIGILGISIVGLGLRRLFFT